MLENRYDLRRLREAFKPIRLRWFPRLRSTNDHAAALRARHDMYAPAIVLAGSQTAGRGRNLNRWWSHEGCITVTLVLAAQQQLALHQLPLIAGLAVRDAVAEFAAEPRIGLKWPNDVVFRGRKLAGVLCERVHGAELIGIGVNVNETGGAPVPGELGDRIGFLSQVVRRRLDKTDVLISILRRLYAALLRREEREFASVLREYERYHALRGRRVSVWVHPRGKPIQGTCQGLDRDGRLLVSRRGTRHRIVAGHVQVR